MEDVLLKENIPKEGKLYKMVKIRDVTFNLQYGYYDEVDRKNNNLNVIYPNLLNNPVYTKDGLLIVTMMQDACKHFKGEDDIYLDCSLCQYFERVEELFGICHCLKNIKKK